MPGGPWHPTSVPERLEKPGYQSTGVPSIGHFIVVDGSEAEADLLLIQTFLLYDVNQVILMLTIIFQEQFP